MIFDTSAVIAVVNLVLPYFASAVIFIVGIGAAGWIVQQLIGLMRSK